MSDEGTFYIPSVNEQVNKLLQSYALKIHLISDLLYKHYHPFSSVHEKFIKYTLIEEIILDIIKNSGNLNWKEFYRKYSLKKESMKNKVNEILVNIRDSRIGIPILTGICKEVFSDERSIKRYLSLYIIEEIFEKWSEEKRENVPGELFKRYSKFIKSKKDSHFEELASRLLNKMFFSSILVNKITEELEYRMFDPHSLNLKQLEEYKYYKKFPLIFLVYMEEMGRHSSNPFGFHVAIKKGDVVTAQGTPFRTHVLVSNFILNNCEDKPIVVFNFNTNKEIAEKLEFTITRKNKSILKKMYNLP